MPLTLTVTVSGLQPGTSYDLYRYDDVSKVPTTTFTQHAADASWTTQFTAAGTSRTITQSVDSDDQVIYQAVPPAAASRRWPPPRATGRWPEAVDLTLVTPASTARWPGKVSASRSSV